MKEVRFLGLGKGLFFMKRKVRRIDEIVTRFATLGMLSALGFVLMAFTKFPYPFAPWLEIELSEIVTIIAYALYGLPGGIIVAVLKTVLKLLAVGERLRTSYHLLFRNRGIRCGDDDSIKRDCYYSILFNNLC